MTNLVLMLLLLLFCCLLLLVLLLLDRLSVDVITGCGGGGGRERQLLPLHQGVLYGTGGRTTGSVRGACVE